VDHPTKATKISSRSRTEQTENDIRQQPVKVTYKEPEQRENMPEQPTYQDERHEYLKWHYKLNHDGQTEYGQNVPERRNLLTLLVQKQKKRFPT
jgi:hypothetical protein